MKINMTLKAQIEALLFVAVKPLSVKELSQVLETSSDKIKASAQELSEDYLKYQSGLVLLTNQNSYQLSTAPAVAKLVKDYLENETSGELSQASLEALTIIAYRGPIAKQDLEQIRGVNCSLIIRNLLIRGLIEEKFSQTLQANLYNISFDFLRFLGLEETSKLPDYTKLSQADLGLSKK